jgi:hypothetical protein
MSELKLGGKDYRESHPLFHFYATLVKAQSLLFAFPKKWGDFAPHEYAVQFLYGIEDALKSSNPKSKELFLQEISESIEKQTVFISEAADLKLNIASTEQNKDVMLLLGTMYEVLHACVSAKDHIELENKDLSQNLLYILEKITEYLYVFMEWVRAFVYVFSMDESGKLYAQAKASLWDLEKVKRLNV